MIKLSCDCGNEGTFEEAEVPEEEFDEEFGHLSEMEGEPPNFELTAYDYRIFIKCTRCNHGIYVMD